MGCLRLPAYPLHFKYENVDFCVDWSNHILEIGDCCVYVYVDDDEEDTYSIVGSLEADPFENKVSNESPIGAALIGSKVGDIIPVVGPNGTYDIKVLKIA